MIPKIIHYCWINGNNEMPENVKKCIESWKKNFIDYEFKLWNDKNFNIMINRYVKEAYEVGKYAFVSDYIRLFALYEYGGIYLDTDVKVFQNFEELLNSHGFIGFETEMDIGTCVMACEKGNHIIGELLSEYNKRRFILPDGSKDLTPNVVYVTKILKKYGLKSNGKLQVVDDLVIYPRTFFCPRDYYGILEDDFSDKTYAQHLFNGSWADETNRELLEKKHILENKYGPTISLVYYTFALLRKEGIYQVFIQWKTRREKKKNHKL